MLDLGNCKKFSMESPTQYSIINNKITNNPSDWDEEWQLGPDTLIPAESRNRLTTNYILNLIPDGYRYEILDVGGCQFYETFDPMPFIGYTTIDIDKPIASNGYVGDRLPNGLTYDGKNLPFERKTFDMILMGFMLHHASEHSLDLLEQAKKITKNHIIIIEDICSTEHPIEWINSRHEHQPGGMFRSDKEWRVIFRLMNLTLHRSIILRREDDPSLLPYRVLYHLHA
jgi:SAM-dependent methyltransferase